MAFRKKKTSGERRPQLMDGQDDISFRRSRTLQGTTSSNVKAANQQKAELKSYRLKKQQQTRRRRFYTTAIITLILLILGVWYLVGQYTVGIGTLSFSPSTTTSELKTSLYKDAISKYLGTQPAERFRFAINQARLTQFVADSLPEVKSVQVDGGSSNTTDFKLTLRQPIASWSSNNHQSYVDEEGVSFTNNYFAKPSVVITDNSGAKTDGSKAVVSERFLRFLGRLVSLTNTSGLGTVTEASIPKNTAREIDIKLKGKSYYIKTHIDRDPAATVEDIKRVVTFLEQKKITPSYIDVRVSGRAFYK
ncbi:MAG: hypothetical protein Q7T74_00735 [Candidatus Saccharibacteria bacterium]|nr:hypothetical protein [Candidatus Saccharibacteria bacterium]